MDGLGAKRELPDLMVINDDSGADLGDAKKSRVTISKTPGCGSITGEAEVGDNEPRWEL